MENPQAESGWSFNPGEESPNQTPESTRTAVEPVTWTGSEFIAVAKTPMWYMSLASFIFVSCAVLYFISGRDLIPVVSVAVIGILFGIIAGKQPRQLQYSISDQGIGVGQKHYSFSEFKSFSVQHDGAIGYISLLPLHHLRPELTIYFAPDDEQRIFDTLAQFLPNEQRAESPIDRLIKRIHF